MDLRQIFHGSRMLSCLGVTVLTLVSLALLATPVEAASTCSAVMLAHAASPSFFAAFLHDPNVAFLLFLLAIIGMFLEVAHPRAIIPGAVGAIALVLFLLSASALTPNWAGFVLMVLAFAFLVLGVKFLAHGILSIGAAIALVSGTLIFFNGGDLSASARVHPWLIYVMGVVIGLLGFTVMVCVKHTRHIPSGVESMLGARVVALTPLRPVGRVNYAGENWAATLEPPTATADPGSELRIVAVEGLCLHVQLFYRQALIDSELTLHHE